MFTERWQKKNKEKFLIMLVLISGIICAGWHFGGSDYARKISDLRFEQQRLVEEIKILNALENERTRIESEWSESNLEKDRLIKAIPPIYEFPGVLGSLEEMLDSFSESLHFLRVGDMEYEDNHIKVNISLDITDQPRRLQNLLRQLENFPHLLILDRLEWGSSDGGEVEMQLSLKVILFNPGHLSSPGEDWGY
jgi:Tfp pilus assembly protein PilO